MMQEPIQDRRGQDWIIEDLTPVREALVAGHNQTPTFIAADQQAEEQTGLLPREWQISQLIENQETGIRQLLQHALQPILLPGAAQPTHQRLPRQKQHR